MMLPQLKRKAIRSRHAIPSCSASDLRLAMTAPLPKTSVAEILADKIVALRPGGLPAATVLKCEDLLIDIVGLASRHATRIILQARLLVGTTMAHAPSSATNVR